MKHTRGVAPVGYALALLLILIPLGEATAAVMPMSPGSSQWRFGAVGLFSRALLLPMAGLVLAAATAWVTEHRRTLRALSVLAACAAIMLLAVAGVFALDAIETSSRVQGAARRAFQMAGAIAFTKLVLVAAVAGLLGRRGWKSSRLSGAERHRQAEPAILIAT